SWTVRRTGWNLFLDESLLPHPFLAERKQAIEDEEKDERTEQTKEGSGGSPDSVEVGNQPATQQKQDDEKEYEQLEFGPFPMAAHCVPRPLLSGGLS
ncbi:MAG: hypothetical protein KJZ86_14495, partial [Caldilineaceae bacterium]|nr:hypothetical protein [Caldilineaceae bacterium]HRJ44659.1 hypothetical protein [Caldilineaceae bacterium]